MVELSFWVTSIISILYSIVPVLIRTDTSLLAAIDRFLHLPFWVSICIFVLCFVWNNARSAYLWRQERTVFHEFPAARRTQSRPFLSSSEVVTSPIAPSPVDIGTLSSRTKNSFQHV